MLLALALATGLVAATGSIGALLQESVTTPAARLGRPADLVISSAFDVDYDLPSSLAGQVAAVPGVAAVEPILRRPLAVQTPGGRDSLTLLGANLEGYFGLRDLHLAAGYLPAPGETGLVALAPWAMIRDLRLGQAVTLTLPTGDVPLPVAGLLEVDSLAAAQAGLVVYAPYETAAALVGVAGVATALEVRLEPGASPRRLRADLEDRLGPAYAVSQATYPDPQLWQRLVMAALVFVDALALLGSTMLVHGALAAAAPARRRQVGLLRAAGASRSQVLGLILLEALLLGLAGSSLGLGLGMTLARLGAGLLLEGEQSGAMPWQPGILLLAAGAGLLPASAGALGPALRTARLPLVAALRPAAPPAAAAPGRAAAALARVSGGHRRLPPWMPLAAAGLAHSPGRALLIIASLASILAMFLGNVGVLSILGEELAGGLGRLAGGDYLILPGLTTLSFRELAGQDTSDVPPLDPGLLAALGEMDGEVWTMAGTTAGIEALETFPGQPTLLLDVEGYARMGSFRFQAGDWPGALAAFQRGPAVLLTVPVARRLGAHLGEPVRLPTPEGPVDFTVAGIGDSEFTTCVLDLADGQALLGANEVNGFMVQVQPGADKDGVRQSLRAAVREHGATLVPLGHAATLMRTLFARLRLSAGLLIAAAGLVAVLGVVNANLTSVAERRQEIGLLRAVGTTQAQLARLVLAEAALQGAAAAIAGTVLGWAVTLGFLAVARSHLGLPAGSAGSAEGWLPLVVSSLGGLLLWPLLGAAAALAAARQAARLPVVELLVEV